jgi:hypothetical protein
VVARTVGHFWPELPAWLDALRDPRDPNRLVYPARCLTWTGLLVFLLKLGSRRQIRFELDSPTALECLEKSRSQQRQFAWLTNFRVDPNTVTALGNRGGRLRWTIENEGFNIQKNGGFALEHAYGTGPWAIKNFYLLMQLAHLVLQLMERGSLLVGRCQTLSGSLRALGRRLAESLRHRIIDADALDVAAAARIQIRLSPS